MARITKDKKSLLEEETRLVISGAMRPNAFGFVNIPPYRGSTVTYPNGHGPPRGPQPLALSMAAAAIPTSRGRLKKSWNDLEGLRRHGHMPVGCLSAVTTALLSCVKAGDDLLMAVASPPDRPSRNSCQHLPVVRYGQSTTCHDPMIGAGIEALAIRPSTRASIAGKPGLPDLRAVQDAPAAVAVAKKHWRISTLIDNTWATALLFKPMDFGIDISINAATTKYPSGRSDVLIGLVAAANEAHFP